MDSLKEAVDIFVSCNNFTKSFEIQQAKLVYYLTGLVLCATEKESVRRGNSPIVHSIEILLDNTCCIDAESAQMVLLPTGKIDRVDCY